MNTNLTIKLQLRQEHFELFCAAKALTERALGGGITDDQFVQMMLLQGARRETKLCEGRRIDSKFSTNGEGEIVKASSGEIVSRDEPLFLFRGRDRLAIEVLKWYRQRSLEDACKPYQFENLDRMIAEFEEFARRHPEQMKQPSITEGKPFTPRKAGEEDDG